MAIDSLFLCFLLPSSFSKCESNNGQLHYLAQMAILWRDSRCGNEFVSVAVPLLLRRIRRCRCTPEPPMALISGGILFCFKRRYDHQRSIGPGALIGPGDRGKLSSNYIVLISKSSRSIFTWKIIRECNSYWRASSSPAGCETSPSLQEHCCYPQSHNSQSPPPLTSKRNLLHFISSSSEPKPDRRRTTADSSISETWLPIIEPPCFHPASDQIYPSVFPKSLFNEHLRIPGTTKHHLPLLGCHALLGKTSFLSS